MGFGDTAGATNKLYLTLSVMRNRLHPLIVLRTLSQFAALDQLRKPQRLSQLQQRNGRMGCLNFRDPEGGRSSFLHKEDAKDKHEIPWMAAGFAKKCGKDCQLKVSLFDKDASKLLNSL